MNIEVMHIPSTFDIPCSLFIILKPQSISHVYYYYIKRNRHGHQHGPGD